MYALSRGGRRSINIWPGFVDALATLLLVVIFVLMVFMVAQFFLSAALSGRDEALERLNRQVNELAELLALERAANADLRINVAQLSSELQSSLAERESLSSQLTLLLDEREAYEQDIREARAAEESLATQVAALMAERDDLEQQLRQTTQMTEERRQELEDAYKTIEADKQKIEAQLAELAILKSLRDEMTAQLSEMETALRSQEEAADALRAQIEAADQEAAEQARLLAVSREETAKQITLSEEAQSKVDLLNRQIAALRQQLARLAVALEAAEAANEEKEVQIADLGRRLNVALATKVQELARYRSEFFGRLREILGNRPDMRIVGDRFVFQSELLFDTGSADLGDAGQAQLRQLATTLTDIAAEIPDDINWILRVDGHTDRRPISTAAYRSNWELSTARAVSVVNFLINHGVPADRLAATGFGEFQPLDSGSDEISYRRNRRIEFKLTEK
ncbi:MAG: peptidoglycan -binding protein [Kiloniellales bacterium]